MNLVTLIDFNCIVLNITWKISLASIIDRHRFSYDNKSNASVGGLQHEMENTQMQATMAGCHLWCGRFDRNTIWLFESTIKAWQVSLSLSPCWHTRLGRSVNWVILIGIGSQTRRKWISKCQIDFTRWIYVPWLLFNQLNLILYL